jgi:hypothetical protein
VGGASPGAAESRGTYVTAAPLGSALGAAGRGSSGVRCATRSLPLTPRSGVSVSSAASARYAAVGASARVSASLTARVAGVAPSATSPSADAVRSASRIVTMLHSHAAASTPTTSDDTTSSHRSARGESPARCHRLLGSSGSWRARSTASASSSAASASPCGGSSGAALPPAVARARGGS